MSLDDDDDTYAMNSSMKINHIHLRVSNLSQSLNFYKSILGFRILKEDMHSNTAFLATNPSSYTDRQEMFDQKPPLIILSQLQNNFASEYSSSVERQAGLYHFAILLPEREYLAAFLRYIQENLDQQYYEGMADHAVSESIYIHDPDHIGIEIYRDRSPSEWSWINNKVHMVTKPLDVTDLLTSCKSKTWNRMPQDTTIGHVHLHVSDLNRARKFYNGVLGLCHTATYPGAYFFAANGYHHHVATNTWIGTNILPANNNKQLGPGLDHYAIALPDNNKEINKLRNNLSSLRISIDDDIADNDGKYHDDSFYVYDPDGIKIQFLFC